MVYSIVVGETYIYMRNSFLIEMTLFSALKGPKKPTWMKCETKLVPEDCSVKCETKMMPEDLRKKLESMMITEDPSEKCETKMMPENLWRKFESKMITEDPSEKSETKIMSEERIVMLKLPNERVDSNF